MDIHRLHNTDGTTTSQIDKDLRIAQAAAHLDMYLADVCKTPEDKNWWLARFVQDPESLISAHNGARGGSAAGQSGMGLLISLSVEERYTVAGRVASG